MTGFVWLLNGGFPARPRGSSDMVKLLTCAVRISPSKSTNYSLLITVHTQPILSMCACVFGRFVVGSAVVQQQGGSFTVTLVQQEGNR